MERLQDLQELVCSDTHKNVYVVTTFKGCEPLCITMCSTKQCLFFQPSDLYYLYPHLIYMSHFFHHSGTSMNGLDEARQSVYLVRHTQMDKRCWDCRFPKDWLAG